jgi:FtsP/CotA-like multicopper oxidase with cupredoxin domain
MYTALARYLPEEQQLGRWVREYFKGSTALSDRCSTSPSFVTQCPIAANHSFLYTFPSGQQAGTFWYHSHLCELISFVPRFIESDVLVATQYCDGLRGALVIYDPNDPNKHLYGKQHQPTPSNAD